MSQKRYPKNKDKGEKVGGKIQKGISFKTTKGERKEL